MERKWVETDVSRKYLLRGVDGRLCFSAGNENVMNQFTFPCAVNRCVTLHETLNACVEHKRGGAFWARPACHHVPAFLERCGCCDAVLSNE